MKTSVKNKKSNTLDILRQKAALLDTLVEYIIERDPDIGLELRASFEDDIRQSMISKKAGKTRRFNTVTASFDCCG